MFSNKYSKTEILAIIGEKLRNRRLNLDLRQSDVSEDLGISRKTLVDIEKGRGTSLYNFLRLVECYNILEDIFNVLSLPNDFDFDLYIKESKKMKKYASHRK